jgi:TonB family protein
MIFSLWKTSLAFFIALGLQLLFFSMMQVENREVRILHPQYNNIQLFFMSTEHISDSRGSKEVTTQLNTKKKREAVEQKYYPNKSQLINSTSGVKYTEGKTKDNEIPKPKEKPFIPVMKQIKEEVNTKKIIVTKNNKFKKFIELNKPIQNTKNNRPTRKITNILRNENLSVITSRSNQTNHFQNEHSSGKTNQTLHSNKLKQTLASISKENNINLAYKNKIEFEYNSTIRGSLHGNHRYPHRAVSRQQSGTATLWFTLLPNGMVDQSSITSTSGHKILDRAAITMLQRSAPFPPFPIELQKKYLEFIISVEFRLD